MDKARELLRSKFGFSDFLPGQAEIVEAVLAGRDAIAIMPTGSGKSLLYQLPAAAPGPGIVLVCSPLIALMRDQLRALDAKGIAAVALHSMQEDEEAAAALDAVRSGRARLLYAAPERLVQEGAQHLLRSIRVRLFAIDEAHCVSHWGHEFRPDYRQLGDIARKLGAPPMLAVTATAGPRTSDDIARTLFSRPPQIFQRSFARPNLSLDFARKRPSLRQIVDFARRGRAAGKESGIIYCNSRNKTDALARELSRLGFDALPYHAGLDAHTRSESQDAFFTRQGAVMVATIAFGMGVDKPDVRFIVHADLPTSVEGYYQEIGRAGRDGAPARALTLFSPAELALRWRMPEAAQESEAAAGDYARRQAMARLAATPGCRFQRLLAEFGEESSACGRCDHCRWGPMAWPRRLSSLAIGWRAGLASGFAARGDLPEGEADVPYAAPASAPVASSIRQEEAPLTVDEARLMRELEAERRAIAKRRGVAPRTVASEQALRALARARPDRLDDPLFSGIEDAAALLRIIGKAR
ncbi:MAG: RecQ family ATP-dependent DNA helicase [Alphaproteobacteria bacterium]|nr:RecQ family ATP-dependent DNA helicase [Alphaproteobacteria bacterium]MBM3652653.1 RecQ family ATP-dependent DNA helicase [Alphaproteobacteria bacterium]